MRLITRTYLEVYVMAVAIYTTAQRHDLQENFWFSGLT